MVNLSNSPVVRLHFELGSILTLGGREARRVRCTSRYIGHENTLCCYHYPTRRPRRPIYWQHLLTTTCHLSSGKSWVTLSSIPTLTSTITKLVILGTAGCDKLPIRDATTAKQQAFDVDLYRILNAEWQRPEWPRDKSLFTSPGWTTSKKLTNSRNQNSEFFVHKKIRQNERSSAFLVLKVNKLSRIFSSFAILKVFWQNPYPKLVWTPSKILIILNANAVYFFQLCLCVEV